MTAFPKYPAPGCIVEFMEGNAANIAYVLEETSGKLRLLLPGRREMKLSANRLLPWIGPQLSANLGREEAIRILEEKKTSREKKAASIPLLDLWELAQGELSQASANWFAELMESDPDIDAVAAYGRALLGCKSHFRFQPPEFAVFDAEVVEKRLAEKKAKEEREALVAGGSAFLRALWDVASKKRPAPPENAQLDPDVAKRLENMLFARLANPESQEDESLWQLLGKGLPDIPHLPLQLLIAWGKLPRHYNFWLDRAGYEAGDEWWLEAAEETAELENAALHADIGESCDLALISIDSPKTHDVDDAFHIEARENGGWKVSVALACPALRWNFGGALDRLVIHRATSVYLPEGDMHMLPEILGTKSYSLLAGQPRPVFLLHLDIDGDGNILSCRPALAKASLAANLNYADVQAVLDAENAGELPANPAAPYAQMLFMAKKMAISRENRRIADGAVIMERPEPVILLDTSGEEPKVDLLPPEESGDAQKLIAELMIAASGAIADWCAEKNLPLLHRAQQAALPREYAGVWSRPEDLSRVMRALVPSSLEVTAKPHAALALDRYAPITSPLRRYTDLVNEAQVLHYLQSGAPRWREEGLEAILGVISPALEAAGHIQRYRPRYWKLLYFRQQGDKVWWNGVITEENENFVNVSLPGEGLFARGKRNMFDERACPGQKVRLRLGKVNPLYNEIHIIEVLPAE